MAYSIGGKRNIVVMGKTGCGKSTLANKIVCVDEENADGPPPFKVAQSFEAVTTKIESCLEEVIIGSSKYSVNMIDTIGFSDTRESGAMKDSSIIVAIKKHIKSRAPEGISLIIFVFRNGRFTDEEKKVFKIISDNFSDIIKEMSCLVITGCDGLNDRARNKVIERFKTNALTMKFAAIMGKGIYTAGFPDINDLGVRAKRAAILDQKDDIAPIHDVIAKARLMYLQEEIQKEKFWAKFSVCTIL